MSIQNLAQQLREAIVNVDLDTIHSKLFAPHVESIEPQFEAMPHAKGVEQLQEKANLFRSGIETLHSREISEEVLVSGNYIALQMAFDATFKNGQRQKLSEIITYKVEDGKIVSETFHY